VGEVNIFEDIVAVDKTTSTPAITFSNLLSNKVVQLHFLALVSELKYCLFVLTI